MGLNVVEKIIKEHLADGASLESEEIALNIDYTLTQDSTGTLAYLQFEALGIPKVKTKLSVSFVDHNTLQTGFENADDHKYLQTVAAKKGIYFSRPGNGICHQVFLERFAVPGGTLIGSDSHTPTAGGIGMIAIGAGGLDVAVAMAGSPYYITKPKICKIELKGKLNSWVSAKDIILEVLRILTVKGGVGRIFEYSGEGLHYLSVPERATITNMGAELGATTSVFPSDEQTRIFLKAQGREKAWREILPDKDCLYDEELIINLSELEPMIAMPHSPDKVVKLSDVLGKPVQQVLIGSCTNGSYLDMQKVAYILRNKSVDERISLGIAPGSKQVLNMLALDDKMASLIESGARILESACGFCIGMGQAPETKGVSLRTNNRNFKGRSGTEDGEIFLVSPEVAAYSATKGVISDPRELGEEPVFDNPRFFHVNDNMIIPPKEETTDLVISRGPNIVPLEKFAELENSFEGEVVLKVEDNITTDDIMPSTAKLLPFRSNVPELALHCFEGVDPLFPDRAKKTKNGIIVAGENYGQGSSREHAALVPRFLGIRAVIAKSFARIHKDNLINMGIIPLTFADKMDYDKINLAKKLNFDTIGETIKKGEKTFKVNLNSEETISLEVNISKRQAKIILAGGLLNYANK